MAPKQRNVVGSLSSSSIPRNLIIAKYCQRNDKKKVTYELKTVTNENLKFSKLSREEKHTYRERLSKLQVRKIDVPRLIDWGLFTDYECENQLRDMMRMTYVYPGDGDTFEDLSWERAFSIHEDVYKEWCCEFFSTIYFERKVNMNNIMREVCVWFRLCGKEHAYTLPGFAVALGLYEQHEIEHRLFEAHFLRLERSHNDYDGIPAYWNRVGDPACARRNSSTLRNPLMKILQKLITWGVLHRRGSRDKCSQPDLWVMKFLEETKNGNAAWIIAEYLSRRALGIKDKSDIYGGHYVTRLAKNRGYFDDDELDKCSDPELCEKWDDKGFGKALDRKRRTLGPWTEPVVAPLPPPTGNVHGGVSSSFDSGWGDWNRELNDIERRNVWRDSKMMRNNYVNDYSMPFLQHMVQEANYEMPTYNPPNVSPYPFPYTPYPGPYPYPYPRYAPFPEPTPMYGRVPKVGGSSYDVGGSSSRARKKKKRRVFSVFEEDDNYETEDSEEAEEMDEDDA